MKKTFEKKALICPTTTLPKTNIAPENKPGPQKETIAFQAFIFGCKRR